MKVNNALDSDVNLAKTKELQSETGVKE